MDTIFAFAAGAATTVVGGMFGRITLPSFIEGWKEYQRIRRKVHHDTAFYSTVNNHPILSSPATPEEARREMRSLASQVAYIPRLIPGYRVLAFCWFVPSVASIRKAAAGLRGYSNSFGDLLPQGRSEFRHDILEAMRLEDEPRPKRSMSEGEPGGRYIVDGKWVNANGEEIGPPLTRWRRALNRLVPHSRSLLNVQEQDTHAPV